MELPWLPPDGSTPLHRDVMGAVARRTHLLLFRPFSERGVTGGLFRGVAFALEMRRGYVGWHVAVRTCGGVYAKVGHG